MPAPLQGLGAKARRRSYDRPLQSEINVTPFVDVMLVLLIIFMVTAPMMTVGVPVDLPKVKAQAMTDKTEPLTISITATGEIFLMDAPVDLDSLVPKLQAVSENKQDTRLYVRGDQSIQFGKIMDVMAHLNQAGFEKVALLAEMPKTPKTKG